MAKRFRIELGFLGMTFVVVLLICLFLWMFILGVWFGQRMMGKGPSPVVEKTLKGKVPEELPTAEEVEPPPAPSGPVSSENFLTASPSIPSGSESSESVPLEKPPAASVSKPKPEPKPEVKPEPKPEAQAESKTPSPVKSTAPSKPYYTLQVASFKDPSEAERYARFFRDRGYFSQVVKAEIPRKGVWYRVYVGKFRSLAQAKGAYLYFKRKGLIKQAYIKRVD